MKTVVRAFFSRSVVLLVPFLWAAFAVPLGTDIARAQPASDNWSTPMARKLGVKLEKTFDSSGPDAWDPKKHPLVFITSEGPGYGGLLSGVKLPGVAIFDANSRQAIASQQYDVLSWGWKNVFEPHGLGVSGDGKWLYLPTGEGSFGTNDMGRLLIINARTLKVDKVLRLQSNAHHAKAFRRSDGKQLVLVESFNEGHQPAFIIDPANDNKVVGGWGNEELGGHHGSYLNFASPDGKEIFVGVGGGFAPPASAFGKEESWVARIDTMTWKNKGMITIPDGNIVWTAFSADDKYAYFSGAHLSRVFKYDRTADKIVGYAQAGVQGPYGIHLDWADKFIYTVGKGESSHNRGRVLGKIDATRMGKPGGVFPADQFTTDCIRGDHATLHPEPDANELWITCNSSFEIVVFDLDQSKIAIRVRMPHGGSTHSGAFVKYSGWNGEVVSDQNGLQGSALATKRRLLASQAPKVSKNGAQPPAVH